MARAGAVLALVGVALVGWALLSLALDGSAEGAGIPALIIGAPPLVAGIVLRRTARALDRIAAGAAAARIGGRSALAGLRGGSGARTARRSTEDAADGDGVWPAAAATGWMWMGEEERRRGGDGDGHGGAVSHEVSHEASHASPSGSDISSGSGDSGSGDSGAGGGGDSGGSTD